MTSSLNDTIAVGKLGYDADSEDGDNGDEDDAGLRTVKSSEGSSEAESSAGGSTPKANPLMPGGAGKPLKKVGCCLFLQSENHCHIA